MKRVLSALILLAMVSCGGSSENGGQSTGGDGDSPLDEVVIVTPTLQIQEYAPEAIAEIGANFLRAAIGANPATGTAAGQVKAAAHAALDAFPAFVGQTLARSPGETNSRTRAISQLGVDYGCINIPLQMPFEQNGFTGTVSMDACFKTEDGKVTMYLAINQTTSGSTPETLGKTLNISGTLNTEQDACPDPDGKTQGIFSVTMATMYSSASESSGSQANGIIEMSAENDEEGILDKADLNYEGSLNYQIDDSAWNLPFTSTANAAAPKDVESIVTQLYSNLDFPTASLGSVSSEIDPEKFIQALTIALAHPSAFMVVGNEEAEKHWLTENACVKVITNPESLSVSPGEEVEFEARVERIDDGQSVAADLVATANESVTPEETSTTEDSPATMTYTAPQERDSAYLNIKATTKAGKASRDISLNLGWQVYLDSTLELTAGTATMIGHVQATVPLHTDETGFKVGTAPVAYLSFSGTASDCQLVGSGTAGSLSITGLSIGPNLPSDVSLKFYPFTTTENVTAVCPEAAGPIPYPLFFFGGTFLTVHQDELTEAVYTIDGWETGTTTGVAFKKTYERTVEVSSGIVRETTILEIRGEPAQPVQ